MAMRRSMTRNWNHDNASSRKRFKPWSDLNHDLLFLVMVQLGVIDFVSFSGVCKSWRSLALINRKMFMASIPPMPMWISNHAYKNESYCHLENFEGRKFKTLLPYSFGRTCVGLTCGYLVLFGDKTHDFWLVNPITRHELHFPDVPIEVGHDPSMINAILVFSPSVFGWVFIMLDNITHKIWFSIADKGAWNHVSTTFTILSLHAFKGKIYTLDKDCRLYEMRLNPEPKLTLLDVKNHLKQNFICPEFVSSGENLYVMDHGTHYKVTYKVEEIDFGKMMWVSPEKSCAVFVNLNYSAAINHELWVDPLSQYHRYAFFHEVTDKGLKYKLFIANMWYFPHSCLNDNFLYE